MSFPRDVDKVRSRTSELKAGSPAYEFILSNKVQDLEAELPSSFHPSPSTFYFQKNDK